MEDKPHFRVVWQKCGSGNFLSPLLQIDSYLWEEAVERNFPQWPREGPPCRSDSLGSRARRWAQKPFQLNLFWGTALHAFYGVVTTVFSSAESKGIMCEILLCSLSRKNVKPRGLYLYQRFPVMQQRQQESNCRQLIILLHNFSYSWRLRIQLITLKPYCIQIIPLATAMPKFQSSTLYAGTKG